MDTLLQINSSLQGADSQSSRLAGRLADGLLTRHPRATHILRDLAADSVPHLDGAAYRTFVDPSAAVTPAQRASLALSDRLIGELKSADVLVIGAPLYNFGIPSTLKAWIDHVTRAQVTFRMTEAGAQGLLRDKKAYVILTRGGQYQGTPDDLQSPYFRMALGLLGITDVDLIHAEGLAMGPPAVAAALDGAHRCIRKILEAA